MHAVGSSTEVKFTAFFTFLEKSIGMKLKKLSHSLFNLMCIHLNPYSLGLMVTYPLLHCAQ